MITHPSTPARFRRKWNIIFFVMGVISWTDAALLGATIALVAQRDNKKGLAHSTMSQLGYMMLALVIRSYNASLFHLITLAYSKILL